jgi:repressor LexA
MKKFSKEEQLLDFIKSYLISNGYPPTVREMCKAIKVSSTSTIFYYLNKLENTNRIKRNPNKNRAIEIVDNDFNISNSQISTIQSDNFTRIPVLGTVTCGEPILAVQTSEEYFMVSPTLFKGDDLFILTAQGDSMINAGILDGDIIIVERRNTARNGEIVVAMTEENEVTLKTFYKEKDHIRLQPENDTMDPFIFDNVFILGKAIGLYRKI